MLEALKVDPATLCSILSAETGTLATDASVMDNGYGCLDTHCGRFEDLLRIDYFMSQKCVWLSQSKHEHLPDFAACANIHNDIADSNRSAT